MLAPVTALWSVGRMERVVRLILTGLKAVSIVRL